MLSCTICFWPSAFAQQTYTPPEVTSAGDAYTSYNVVFDGLFVLDIGLSNEGDIRRVEALRDPGSMLGAAKTSVRTWGFRPASEGGKQKPSRLTVAFLYRPANHANARPSAKCAAQVWEDQYEHFVCARSTPLALRAPSSFLKAHWRSMPACRFRSPIRDSSLQPPKKTAGGS